MNRTVLLVAPAAVLTAAWLAGCSDTSTGSTSQSAPATQAPYTQASAAPTLATGTTGLGEIIVDGKGMTAYVFDKDVAGSGTSACTGDCLKTWKPIAASSAQFVVDGVTAPVGTITGANGPAQITVGGLPIYTFAKDKAPGDTAGQLVKGVWHVVTPSGQKVG